MTDTLTLIWCKVSAVRSRVYGQNGGGVLCSTIMESFSAKPPDLLMKRYHVDMAGVPADIRIPQVSSRGTTPETLLPTPDPPAVSPVVSRQNISRTWRLSTWPENQEAPRKITSQSAKRFAFWLSRVRNRVFPPARQACYVIGHIATPHNRPADQRAAGKKSWVTEKLIE